MPRDKDNSPQGTQKNISLYLEEEKAREGRQGNFKIHFTNSPRHYMAEILQTRRKTPNYPINQAMIERLHCLFQVIWWRILSCT